ncbi:MAG: oligoendopeptidase F [Firmicutes bacterium]|nr:oligoendopeptidase F [Bacillota bacterium]
MKREDIAEKYKWNLNRIVNGSDEFEKLFKDVESNVDACLKFKGKLNDFKVVERLLSVDTDLSIKLERLYCYAAMHSDEDVKDNFYLSLEAKVENLVTRYNSNNSFIIPEFLSYDDNLINDYIKRFSEHDKFFKDILREKKHILSYPEEKILAKVSEVHSSFSSIFSILDNGDLNFPNIKYEDKSVKLTHGNYSLFLQNPIRNIRKQAYNKYYKTYRAYLQTITAIYSGSLKKDCFSAKVRNFKSCLEKALFFEDVSPVVYNNLIDSVSKNLKHLHEYVAFRKKTLNVEKLYMYDMYVPIIDEARVELEYEDAFKLVTEGLLCLGQDYIDGINKSFSENYIDVFETENKKSGAYSNSCYGVFPYVLLNYQKTTHDVFTIAHELGHSMHSYYSAKAQPYSKANYTIFVAEVASTVNEVLLIKHILKTTADKNLKKFLLSYYLDMFRTTLFRQTMFSEFEKIAHNLTEKNKPVNSESLSKEYLKLNKKYYGKDIVSDKNIAIEWCRIPHFYRSFYVYKYATGIISAINIANQILKDDNAVTNYKKFLCSGGSDSPVELLKIAGVDLETEKPFDFAMEEFNKTLTELKSLK